MVNKEQKLLQLRRKLQQSLERNKTQDADRYRAQIQDIEIALKGSAAVAQVPDQRAHFNHLLDNPAAHGLPVDGAAWDVHQFHSDAGTLKDACLVETPFRERPKDANAARKLPVWKPWQESPEFTELPFFEGWTCYACDDNAKHLYLLRGPSNDIGFATACTLADAEAVERCAGSKSPLTLTAALCKTGLNRRAQWLGVLAALGVVLRAGPLSWADVVLSPSDEEYLTVADPASHLPKDPLWELLRICKQIGIADVSTTCGWGDSTGPYQTCCSPVHLVHCSGTVILFAPRLHQSRGCPIRTSDECATLTSFAARMLREAKARGLALQSVVVVSGQHAPGRSHFERWYDTTRPRDRELEVAHVELSFNGAHYGA
eukprot:gene3987-14688_t